MELSDIELAHLYDLLQDEGIKMYHHPDDFNPHQERDHNTLTEKVWSEAKRRRFWWAR